MSDTEWRGPRGRGRRLIVPLRLVAIAAFVLSLAGLAPVGAPRTSAAAAVALLVAAPVGRLGFLVWRWWRLGDRRYALVAALLLLILAAGTVVSLQ